MSKRDKIAAMALQGILAKKFDDVSYTKGQGAQLIPIEVENLVESCADAIEYADELLKQLSMSEKKHRRYLRKNIK